MSHETPYYLIDENRMLKYLQRIKYVHEKSGAQSLLALKCFSNWRLFSFMSQYMAGTTSSSPYEARLGYEEFGGETHGYCVAYSDSDVEEVVRYCDKIIFNSVNQLRKYKTKTGSLPVGLRINPQVGWAPDTISDAVRRYSRLGVHPDVLPEGIGSEIDGMMFHYNCENEDFEKFSSHLGRIGENFGNLLQQVDWVSLGGGIAFTTDGYPLDDFCKVLRDFSDRFNVKIYLEPGEAAVTYSTSLVVSVLDIVRNEKDTLIVDAGTEPHLLDVLTYGYAPEMEGGEILSRSDSEDFETPADGYAYFVGGRTCLAGDIFGAYKFAEEVKIGDKLHFINVGGYSMVKKNWFNGLKMPSILHKKINGEVEVKNELTYNDFKKEGL